TTFDYSQPQTTREGQFVSGEERITIWRYDDQFRLSETTLPRPEWVFRYAYDSNSGRLAEIVQPNRTSLRYEIDEYGYVTQFRDPIFAANSAYNLTYDSPDGYQRRLLRIDYPAQNEQAVYREYGYAEAEDGSLMVTETRPISSTEGDIFVLTRHYDERGRLLATEEPAPDEGTIRSDYAYDAFGYVSQISQGNGLRLLFLQHDIAGRLVSLLDGRGTSITLVWDDDRDRVRRLLTDGVERSYAYDAYGNLIEFQRQDVVETYQYNGLNQVIAVTDALGNITRYTYDEAGNLLLQAFEDGTQESYEYDSLNNLTRKTSRGGLITSYETTLNIDGNRTRYTITNPAEEQTTFVYDAIGRLREVLVNDGDGERVKTYTLSYTPLGFVTRIEEGHVPGGRTLTIQYDLLGNPLVSSIDGTETSYTYNSAGWLASITEPNGSTTRYNYDVLGNIITVTLPDGAQQFYRYDENSNLVSFVDALGGETRYSYDDVNR
ncbi:MAG: RHS repeat protein, partial [Anaerolineae bacterium]|nr:RHS repeat protein [Anaerolineae bacterium]